MFREKLLQNPDLTVIPGGGGGRGSPVNNISCDQMMEYISVPNKSKSSMGVLTEKSVTNGEDENTIAIEGFKRLDQAAKERAATN